jgi:hypothetical protein
MGLRTREQEEGAVRCARALRKTKGKKERDTSMREQRMRKSRGSPHVLCALVGQRKDSGPKADRKKRYSREGSDGPNVCPCGSCGGGGRLVSKALAPASGRARPLCPLSQPPACSTVSHPEGPAAVAGFLFALAPALFPAARASSLRCVVPACFCLVRAHGADGTPLRNGE